MTSDKVLLFGYPINRITIEDLKGHLEALYSSYTKDLRPRYATTVNAIFLAQLSGFWLNKRSDPSIVDTLRRADLVTLDSPFLHTAAKLLGSEVGPNIRSEDLLHAAAGLASEKGYSIYLVGGHQKTCDKALQTLKEQFPGIKIAGSSAPNIYTKGDLIEDSIETDPFIIEAINTVKPQILLIQLGHPKQEIWFERVREQLKVPLCIGVGGAFERYLQSNPAEPHASMKMEGTAAVQVRRRITTFLKYTLWFPVLFLYNTVNRFICDIFHRNSPQDLGRRYLFLSEKESLSVVPFPAFVNSQTWAKKPEWMDEALEHDHIVLDFRKVRHIDPAGFGIFYTLWFRAKELNKHLFIIGLDADVRWLFKLQGAWDLIAYSVCSGPEEVLDRMSLSSTADLVKQRDFQSIHQAGDHTILSIFGRLNGVEKTVQELQQLIPVLSQRGCMINLKYCTSITNPGFGFLLQLKALQKSQEQPLVIRDASRFVRKQFKCAKLDDVFRFR